MDPVATLRERFGYPAFRPGQEELVRAVLAGRDALGILPTGGGKSVCYQVPALLLPGLTLVVSPLVSLMADQVDRARRAGIEAERLTADRTPADRERVIALARAGQLRLLLVSPERLATPRFREELKRLPVTLLAVDEAHCISEWGHDFRPSYLELGAIRALHPCPVLALTATATPKVRAEIARVLALRDPVRVVGSFDRPNLSWHVHAVRGGPAKKQALRALVRKSAGSGGTALVYAGTRRTVEAVRDDLAALGLRAEAYHAGLEPEERARVQDAFMAGRAPLVVATNAFGMGVDRSDVRLVAHWQLSGSLEGYYQEAGRAGRDGAPSRCVALHDPDDAALHTRFVDRSHPPPQLLRRLLAELRKCSPTRVATTTLGRLCAAAGGPSTAAAAAALRDLAACAAVRPLVPLPDPDDGAETGAGPSTAREVIVHLASGRVDLGPALRLREAALARVRAVQAYAGARGCRRGHLLAHFGERLTGSCGACDRCEGGRTSGSASRSFSLFRWAGTFSPR
jgi:ATP-dependent DNA helicase RecQ